MGDAAFECVGSTCTAAAVWRRADAVYVQVANVGDSDAVLWCGGVKGGGSAYECFCVVVLMFVLMFMFMLMLVLVIMCVCMQLCD